MKLTIAFHGFMNMPKNVTITTRWLWNWQCDSFNLYTFAFNETIANDTKVQLLINPENPDSQCTTTCIFAEITY